MDFRFRPRAARRAVALLLTAALFALDAAATSDWPQMRGPNRDGHSAVTGLATSWPEEGPPELWRVPLGPTFSGMAVVGGRLYTLDSNAEGEFAVCLDTADGRELWRTPVGKLYATARRATDSSSWAPRSSTASPPTTCG